MSVPPLVRSYRIRSAKTDYIGECRSLGEDRVPTKPDRSVKIGFRLKPDYNGESVNFGSPFIRSHNIRSAKIGLYRWMSVGIHREPTKTESAGEYREPTKTRPIGENRVPTKTGLYRQIGECRFFRSFDHIRYVRRKTVYIGECRSVGMYWVPTKTG